MSFRFDVAVVGAGVVGLACANRLAGLGLKKVLLEKERSIGQGISSRNSEVIHAGIYYQPRSLKARLSVSGRIALYDYCLRRNVPHRRLGKWIVAHSEHQRVGLTELAERGRRNGVYDLRFVKMEENRRIEVALGASIALESPSTGKADSHAFILSSLAVVEPVGGGLALNTSLRGGGVEHDGISMSLVGEQTRTKVRYTNNAIGMFDVVYAHGIRELSAERVLKPYHAKADQFCVSGPRPFSKHVCPSPAKDGSGVQLMLDFRALAIVDPYVAWVDESRRSQYAAEIRKYWPVCFKEKQNFGFVDVRLELGTRESFLDDFVIDVPNREAIDRLVNLFSIESPGLTASLAFADEVASNLQLS
ncbi:COG0579 Predicted dehydrogenase [Comamonadaceae bacterium]